MCGIQFPLALNLKEDTNKSVTRLFSADLIGAALGILVISIIMIPYFGIIYAVMFIMLLKLISLMVLMYNH